MECDEAEPGPVDSIEYRGDRHVRRRWVPMKGRTAAFVSKGRLAMRRSEECRVETELMDRDEVTARQKGRNLQA